MQIACFGSQRSERLHHNVVQITREKVVMFISERFATHADIKTSHRQRDNFIEKFYKGGYPLSSGYTKVYFLDFLVTF